MHFCTCTRKKWIEYLWMKTLYNTSSHGELNRAKHKTKTTSTTKAVGKPGALFHEWRPIGVHVLTTLI